MTRTRPLSLLLFVLCIPIVVAASGDDPDHSLYEFRYITFGVSNRGRLLIVSHTEEGDVLRIISARRASKGERGIYEEG
jgi:hypothetical protein